MLYLATDGGQKGTHGSYSVVIGTDHHTLFTASGTARGEPMNVYRAECYGKLAAITFMHHYTTFLDLDVRCYINHYTDCQKVLKKTSTSKESASP